MSSRGRWNSVLLDVSPLRASHPFARLWAGNSVAGIGSQMTVVAVGVEIYQITGSTFAVGLLGVFSLIPAIIGGLYGGALADTFDRRRVALVAATASWAAVIGIALHAWLGVENVWFLYGFTALNTAATTILSTSRAATIPRLIPPELMPSASALNGLSMGVAVTVGPALAGFLIAGVGLQWTYTVDAVLFCFAFLGIATLPPIPPAGEGDTSTRGHAGFRSILNGLTYLRSAPNIRSGFLMDISAMVFGFPRVLFPALGAVVLGGGALTVGFLTAAAAVGTVICGLFSGRLRRINRHGRAIAVAVWWYGASILLFGAVVLAAQLRNLGDAAAQVGADTIGHPVLFAVACLALASSGAADNVSVIFRNTMSMTAVPDTMRGRMQGLYITVVYSGPRAGDMYAGSLAAGGLIWLPPLLGGFVTIALATLIVRLTPSFWRYDGRDPRP